MKKIVIISTLIFMLTLFFVGCTGSTKNLNAKKFIRMIKVNDSVEIGSSCKNPLEVKVSVLKKDLSSGNCYTSIEKLVITPQGAKTIKLNNSKIIDIKNYEVKLLPVNYNFTSLMVKSALMSSLGTLIIFILILKLFKIKKYNIPSAIIHYFVVVIIMTIIICFVVASEISQEYVGPVEFYLFEKIKFITM